MQKKSVLLGILTGVVVFCVAVKARSTSGPIHGTQSATNITLGSSKFAGPNVSVPPSPDAKLKHLLEDLAKGGRGYELIFNPLLSSELAEYLKDCSSDEAKKIAEFALCKLDWNYVRTALEAIAKSRPELATGLFSKLKKDIHNGSFQALAGLVKGWAQSDPAPCKRSLLDLKDSDRASVASAYLEGRIQVNPHEAFSDSKSGFGVTSPGACTSRLLRDWLQIDPVAAREEIKSGRTQIDQDIWSDLFYLDKAAGKSRSTLLAELKQSPSSEKWLGFTNFLSRDYGSSSDNEEALRLIEKELPSDMVGSAKLKLLSSAPALSPQFAPEILNSLKPGKQADEAARSAMISLGNFGPQIALQWLESGNAGPMSSSLSTMYDSLVRGWAESEPEEMLTAVLQSKDSNLVRSVMDKTREGFLQAPNIHPAFQSMHPDQQAKFLELCRSNGADVYDWMQRKK